MTLPSESAEQNAPPQGLLGGLPAFSGNWLNSGWQSGLAMSQLVGKFVIDVAVLRLICTDKEDDVTQARNE